MITQGNLVLHPTVWEQPAMRRALARRDIGAVYRMLTETGVSQRQIARLTGQSQSEVSEIMQGRRVIGYAVLTRIAEGLGVARGQMGLAATLPRQPEIPTPLPSRLSATDVHALRALTRQLETLAKAYGGSAELLSSVAAQAERLMSVPGSEAITGDVAVAIAELHTVAGWAAFDARQDKTALRHFAQAMELGSDAGDGCVFSKAAYLAGVATAERGHLSDGLKWLQLGRISLNSEPATSRRRELASWLAADSAYVLACMNQVDAAREALDLASHTWLAPSADDQAGMVWVMALTELTLGRLAEAERFAAAAVRHWQGSADRRQAALGDITLAVIHVRAGEPRGPALAHRAITAVAALRSVRARDRLAPLAAALESRRGPVAYRLAALARRVMTGPA